MRITSSLFVSALMQEQRSRGNFTTVINKGSPDAGAIFIVHLGLHGKSDFYGPVPQSFLSGLDATERYFEVLLSQVDQQEIDLCIEKQKKFDPDCWVIEIESNQNLKGINIYNPG